MKCIIRMAAARATITAGSRAPPRGRQPPPGKHLRKSFHVRIDPVHIESPAPLHRLDDGPPDVTGPINEQRRTPCARSEQSTHVPSSAIRSWITHACDPRRRLCAAEHVAAPPLPAPPAASISRASCRDRSRTPYGLTPDSSGCTTTPLAIRHRPSLSPPSCRRSCATIALEQHPHGVPPQHWPSDGPERPGAARSRTSPIAGAVLHGLTEHRPSRMRDRNRTPVARRRSCRSVVSLSTNEHRRHPPRAAPSLRHRSNHDHPITASSSPASSLTTSDDAGC